MTLKTCPQGHKVTTKNAINCKRNPWGLWFTCPACATSLFIVDPTRKLNYEKFKQNAKAAK